MKKIFFYFTAICLLAACSDEIPNQEPPVQAKRAILAYLVANNNLDDYIMDNVNWMYQSLAEAEDSCTLIVYYKPSPSNYCLDGPEILLFASDGSGNVNGQPALESNQINKYTVLEQAQRYTAVAGISTDADVMAANIRTMADMVPSQSYGLIFASHATSWMPATGTLISGRSFGVDGSDSNSINIPDLALTLEETFPGNLDFVMFDACMMQTAEVCYELRNATNYCIASVMETPAIGFPYHRILTDLYQDEIDFDKLCDDIITFNREKDLWGTYAVVDCTQMDAFANAVREQVSQHASTLENLSSHAVQQYGTKQYQYFSFDVADLVKQLNEGILPDDFQTILDQTVLAKSCIDDASSNNSPYSTILTDEERYCGMGMYIPEANDNTRWNAYYESAISWYQAVWAE